MPSAKKPVKRINNRTTIGNMDLLGVPEPADLIRFPRKKRIPASIKTPSISVRRDKNWAGIRGMVKLNWARMTMTRGKITPRTE